MRQRTNQPQQTSPAVDSIPDLVESTLAQVGLRHYSGQAGPVVDALVQREKDLMTQIAQAAADQGLNPSQVKDLISDFGAHIDEDEGLSEALGDDVETALNNINDALNQLVQFAKQNGFQQG